MQGVLYTVNIEMSIMPTKKVVILGLVALVLAGGTVFLIKEADQPEPIFSEISLQEKEQIDAWIEVSDLNQYGDPKETAYAGGTPLFNEATGKTIDRYEYILQRHTDRPWGK